MQEMWVGSLGQEDSMEEEMTTLSGILAWGIPWTEEPGRPQSRRLQRVGHNWLARPLPWHSLNRDLEKSI